MVVTRKQYGTTADSSWSGSTACTFLGLSGIEVSKEFDGSVSSGFVQIDDAFDIEEINITDTANSDGLLSFAAKIITVQLQERCIPTGIEGNVTVTGFLTSDLALPQEGGVTQFIEATDTISPCTDLEVNTYSEGKYTTNQALLEAIKQSPSFLNIKVLKVYPMSEDVSFVSIAPPGVLCDRRISMSGYTTPGAGDAVWTVLTKAQFDAIPLDARNTLLKLLKIDTLLGGDTPQEITVTDGVIDSNVTTLNLGSSHLWLTSGNQVLLFVSVSPEGNLSTLWANNETYYVGILLAIPKIHMESVLGISAINVSSGGGTTLDD